MVAAALRQCGGHWRLSHSVGLHGFVGQFIGNRYVDFAHGQHFDDNADVRMGCRFGRSQILHRGAGYDDEFHGHRTSTDDRHIVFPHYDVHDWTDV